jgi:linoleoyl-CoA desaturase
MFDDLAPEQRRGLKSAIAAVRARRPGKRGKRVQSGRELAA